MKNRDWTPTGVTSSRNLEPGVDLLTFCGQEAILLSSNEGPKVLLIIMPESMVIPGASHRDAVFVIPEFIPGSEWATSVHAALASAESPSILGSPPQIRLAAGDIHLEGIPVHWIDDSPVFRALDSYEGDFYGHTGVSERYVKADGRIVGHQALADLLIAPSVLSRMLYRLKDTPCQEFSRAKSTRQARITPLSVTPLSVKQSTSVRGLSRV